MKIHVGDTVLVRTGKDRTKTGKVIKVIKKSHAKSGCRPQAGAASRIVVEKVNMRTKHIKKSVGKPGQKVVFEASIDASNAMVICPQCKKATRVAHILLKTGRKQRVCKKCKQSIDQEVQGEKTVKKSKK